MPTTEKTPRPPRPQRFNDKIVVRCPSSLPAILEKAASHQMQSPAEYIRRCVVERLTADGFDPGTA